jgi:hypothetical protein
MVPAVSWVSRGPVPGLRAGGDVLAATEESVTRGRVLRLFISGYSLRALLEEPRVVLASAEAGGGRDQPWRCLWRRFSQITMTRPLRRITLHLSQIFLTLG